MQCYFLCDVHWKCVVLSGAGIGYISGAGIGYISGAGIGYISGAGIGLRENRYHDTINIRHLLIIMLTSYS